MPLAYVDNVDIGNMELALRNGKLPRVINWTKDVVKKAIRLMT